MQTLASLSLTPDSRAVAQAQAWLESVGERQRWSARLRFKLGLCLDEALTNIVMHGFPGEHATDGTPAIGLSVLSDDSIVVVDILDNGIPFDSTRSASPELAESLETAGMGGHGLRLMRHYLSRMQYERVRGRNHLQLGIALEDADA